MLNLFILVLMLTFEENYVIADNPVIQYSEFME
jgi:hypothetical protein